MWPEPGSRVPSLPPIRGAREPFDSQKYSSRRQESKGLGASLEGLNQITNLESPGLTPGSRRRSIVSDDNISVMSLRLDSPPRKARAKVRIPPPRRHPHHAQQQQQKQQPRRRRPISASSSDGESPLHRRSNKYHRREQVSRRRGNSLGRLEGNTNSQPGVWTMGVPPAPRRQSIPPPTRRNQPSRPSPPDTFGIAFALNR
ncbi:hypothetical protein Pcinc_010919 [Petrolisthes cinctipes]|uniref:Uncharacterized protein n=1 Tax=Petrolisthes cinctipes TaxID=88211 RepID=A0AAE1G3X9_PETCI|nr:hypothetical protein Pcinc_010919 [Petrolisthes cinctipes]